MSNEVVVQKKIDLATIRNNNPFSALSIRNDSNLHTFDDNKLALMAEKMTELNELSRCFGRHNTSTMNTLMTLTMLNDTSPYRLLRQCSAQIEDRRSALKENVFNLRESKLKEESMRTEVILLKEKFSLLSSGDIRFNNNIEETNFKIELNTIAQMISMKELEIEKIMAARADSIIYIEGTLKDIDSYQTLYEQIKTSNSIEHIDEVDFENAEIEFHLRQAFLHAYRDMMNRGTLGMGTLEYIQQFGVHPRTCEMEVESYINSLTESIDYDHISNWLDSMCEKYKDEYKKVLKRMGIKNLINPKYLYTEKEYIAIEE